MVRKGCPPASRAPMVEGQSATRSPEVYPMVQAEAQSFDVPDADITFYPQVFRPAEGDALLQE